MLSIKWQFSFRAKLILALDLAVPIPSCEFVQLSHFNDQVSISSAKVIYISEALGGGEERGMSTQRCIGNLSAMGEGWAVLARPGSVPAGRRSENSGPDFGVPMGCWQGALIPGSPKEEMSGVSSELFGCVRRWHFHQGGISNIWAAEEQSAFIVNHGVNRYCDWLQKSCIQSDAQLYADSFRNWSSTLG